MDAHQILSDLLCTLRTKYLLGQNVTPAEASIELELTVKHPVSGPHTLDEVAAITNICRKLGLREDFKYSVVAQQDDGRVNMKEKVLIRAYKQDTHPLCGYQLKLRFNDDTYVDPLQEFTATKTLAAEVDLADEGPVVYEYLRTSSAGKNEAIHQRFCGIPFQGTNSKVDARLVQENGYYHIHVELEEEGANLQSDVSVDVEAALRLHDEATQIYEQLLTMDNGALQPYFANCQKLRTGSKRKKTKFGNDNVKMLTRVFKK